MSILAKASAVTLLFIAPVRAGDRPAPPRIVTNYCSGCHSLDGQSQLPFVARLAGQNAAYLESKMARFRSGESAPVDETFHRITHHKARAGEVRMTSAAASHMVGVANSVSDSEMQSAIRWYANCRAATGKGGSARSVADGGTLYKGVLPSGRSCANCHGDNAQGTDAAPRLAGQNAAYVIAQLALFRAGGGNSPRMIEVARSLEEKQLRPIAEYVQSR